MRSFTKPIILQSEEVLSRVSSPKETIADFMRKYKGDGNRFEYQGKIIGHWPDQSIRTNIFEDSSMSNVYQADFAHKFVDDFGAFFEGSVAFVPYSEEAKNSNDLFEYVRKTKKGKIVVGSVSSNRGIQELLREI